MRTRRLALEWLVIAAPYVLAITTFATWWGGPGGPARFLVPLLLPLAIPAGCAWASATSRGARAVMLAALAVSVWLGMAIAASTAAPWREWANHVVDLAAASPAFVPQAAGTSVAARAADARNGFAATIPWIACVGGAAWLLKRAVDRLRTSDGAAAAAAFVIAGGAMAAATIVWRVNGADPLTIVPAELDVLRQSAAGPSLTVNLTERRLVTAEDARTMSIEAPVRRGGRFAPRIANRPLAALPRLPAGTYQLSVKRHGGGDGWGMAGVRHDPLATVTDPTAR